MWRSLHSERYNTTMHFALVAFILSLIAELSAARYVDKKSACPPMLTRNQDESNSPVQCPTVCASDLDCSQDNKCVCVKECGFVCLHANITCPLPPAPRHGYVQGQRTVGLAVEVICDTGYFRTGFPYMRICNADGSWSDVNITCIARSCGDPDVPRHGRRLGMKFQYNDTVRYTCDRGYVLQGPDSRTCQANQTWADTQPLCKPVSCGSPPSVQHANISVYGIGGFVFEDMVTYQCETGYYRDGDNALHCDYSGQWRGVPPVCREIKCPQPKDLQNGKVSSEGGVVRYSCNPGYTLFGSHFRKCQKSGRWTGPEPICFECASVGVRVFVRKRPYFRHGVVQSKTGHTVTVHYPDTDKEEDIVTLGVGTMHYIIVQDRVPDKNEIFIGSRVLAENSKAGGYMFATVFSIVGNSFRVKFNYNGAVVTLGQIRTLEPPRFCASCADPGLPMYAEREDDLSRFIPGMNVIYTCRYTYRMKGSQTRTCLKDGTWTGTAPSCSVYSCDELDAFPPRNGERRGDSFTIGSTVDFSCNEGYSLIGQRQLTCTSSGNWSDSPPSCRSLCASVQCSSLGEKCVYKTGVGAHCVCRENDECRASYEPVCGSDGTTYNNHCIMSATACRSGKAIHMVSRAACLPAALCQIVPFSVCRGFFPRFFYNTTSKKCQAFIAGGCHPSGWNGFATEKQCNLKCLVDVCAQPVLSGPCSQNESRWSYDATTGRCKRFNYGGCFGNENNFESEELCNKKCYSPKKDGSCPKCAEVELGQACMDSDLAVVAKVTTTLPNDDQKHLLRFFVEIDHVLKNTAENMPQWFLQGKVIMSTRYQSPSGSNCTCPRLPLNKKFVLIGGLSTADSLDGSKSGLVLSPRTFTHGWSDEIKAQIKKKCAGFVNIADLP